MSNKMDLVQLFRKKNFLVIQGFCIACSGIQNYEDRTINDLADYDNPKSRKYKSCPEWLENNNFR